MCMRKGIRRCNQLGHIPLHQLPHLVRLDDEGRTVEVFVIVHVQVQHFAGASVDVAVRQGSGTGCAQGLDGRGLGDRS